MDTDLHQIIRSAQPLTNEHFQYFIYQVRRPVCAQLNAVQYVVRCRWVRVHSPQRVRSCGALAAACS